MSIEIEMEVEKAHHEAVKEETQKKERTKLEKRRAIEDRKMLKELGLDLADLE